MSNKFFIKWCVFYPLLLSFLFFVLPVFAINTQGNSPAVLNLDPGGAMNDIIHGQFLSAASDAGTYIAVFAKNIFFHLMVIDLTWSGMNWILDESDFQTIIAVLVKKIMYIGLIMQLINTMDAGANDGNILSNKNWMATIPNSFVALGQDLSAGLPHYSCTVAGSGAASAVTIGNMSTLNLNPGCMLDTGITLALTYIGLILASIFASLSLFTIIPNLVLLFIAIIVAIYIVQGFTLLAMDLCVNFIEAYITMVVGIFLLGFSGSRWTMAFANVFMQYTTMLGLRMLLGIVVFIISWTVISRQIYEGASAIGIVGGWELTINVLGVTFIMNNVCKETPNIAAGMASNSSMMTPGNAIRTSTSGLLSAGQMSAKGVQIVGAAGKKATAAGIKALSSGAMEPHGAARSTLGNAAALLRVGPALEKVGLGAAGAKVSEAANKSTIGRVASATFSGKSNGKAKDVAGALGAKRPDALGLGGDGFAKGAGRIAALSTLKALHAGFSGMETIGRYTDATKIDKKDMEKGADGKMHRKVNEATGMKATGGNKVGVFVGGFAKKVASLPPADKAPANYIATLQLDDGDY